MRVLFYSYEFHPLGGGVGKAVKELFQKFRNYDDLKIDFVTTSLCGKLEVFKYSENITFHRLPIGKREKESYHIQKPWHMFAYTILAYFYTWKLIFSNKYDLSHFFGYPGGLVSMLFNWKIPYVVSLRGIDVPGYNKNYGAYYVFYKPLSRIVWRYAKKVVANSKSLADLANDTSPNKSIDVIPNGIDCITFSPVNFDDKFKTFTVTAGGTLLGRRKGLDQLVKGFARFANDKEDIELVLYGSGQEEESLKALSRSLGISDKVIFRGRVENNVIAAELPRTHVFCLPSLNEGMSNAALEALSAGLPLLLTDTGGTEELLEDERNGFIIPKNDNVKIAKYLEELYKNRELQENMGRESRKLAEEMSWDKVASAYYDLYQEFNFEIKE